MRDGRGRRERQKLAKGRRITLQCTQWMEEKQKRVGEQGFSEAKGGMGEKKENHDGSKEG